ncbi:MAG: signal peptide peptidase SppA [Gammaproteobacteria bacterium]|nr:signal peptide peptidase SppA [Gammaproteobacteria bacterium]
MPTQDTRPNRSLATRILRGIARAFTFVRNFILNVLFILIFFAVLTALIRSDDLEAIPHEAVLVFDPAGILVEQKTYRDPLFDTVFGASGGSQISITDMLDALDFAANDERVKLVILDFSRLYGVDFAEVERIQEAVLRLKDAGKEIWSFANSYSQGTYLLSAAADEVLMDPMGDLIFSGVTASTTYYKGLLDKLNVNVDVYHEGEYKTAIEPFIRSQMSDEAREVNANLLGTYWDRITQQMTSYRNLTETEFASYATSVHVGDTAPTSNLAQLAVERGFIDELVPRTFLKQRYQAKFEHNLREISFRKYLPHALADTNASQNVVAVLVLEGEILGLESAITGNRSSWVQQIDRITKSDEYQALVLRVNSPGGSVTESEEIRRALERYKETNRPLVASFAGTAASGGYWISLPADLIYAAPMTLTGSIGVFGLYPNLENALNSIGITNDVMRTSPYGLANDPMVAATPETHALRKLRVQRYYDYFVNLVANARNLSVEQVHQLAQGRVWLGVESTEIGLVDAIGEIEIAVAKAAELADFADRYRVEYISPESSFRATFFDVGSRLKHYLAANLLPAEWIRSRTLENLRFLRDPADIYAHCANCKLTIR